MQMRHRPGVTSRWLEIGQFLFCFVMDQKEVKVDKKRKKEQCHYPAILIDQSW